ncbi:phage tail fiber repeat family protein [Escherichia coli DEC13A]|uniref:phage tail protein n=1 Tax=Escherichia coli TaxID=562 RepID=UPI0002516607|nr:phage tail protein [Escherichia coli]EET6468791.1 phage tail protein [Escherichia coli]EEV6120748.1 phage tail protein [Escherichia coli]EGP4243853.1 phage tail protein [Escherichia coli]EHX52654.1 phage tail fiber repeat family protein [Escherichia coli DEC13A]EJB4439071.1 phage tail protein [Escherichia coli]
MSTTTRKFKTVITDTGAKKLAQAAAPDGKPVRLTHMAVGDGGGTLPTPDSKQTRLVHEVWRHTVNRVILDATHQNRIIAELVIPPEAGGFWIREIGVFDEHGDLIAVGNTAESYKPTVAEGSGRAQTFRTILTVSSTASVALTVDNTMVMATVDYVDDKLKEHEQSRRHPDASLTAKGFVQLSSATNSDSETLAATPKAVKAAYDLANGKYTAQDATTARKGIVQLSSATNSTSETLAATPKAVKAVMDETNKKAPLNSPALTGTPTTPTAQQGTNNTQIASTAFVMAAIAALVDSSPDALNTLNELAAALGNDPNFATTMTNALAGKQPKDATLTALAGLATAADRFPYFTGNDVASLATLTKVGRDILAKSTVAAVIEYLGLQETVNQASGALQKNQNGADIPDKDRFLSNINVYSKGEVDKKKGMQQYAFNAPSNAVGGKWYPVIFRRSTGSTGELASRVIITTTSADGNYEMNNCEFNGMVMPGGWTDRGSYAAGYFSTYQTNERAIHSIVTSLKEDDVCSVFYVEGRAFPVRVSAEEGLTVIVPTQDYTVGQTTYKWGATNPATESTNAQAILDFNNGRGFYCSHSIFGINAIFSGNLGIGTANALGGNSIVLGDNDTGFKQNGDGVLDAYANGVHVFRFINGSARSLKGIQAGESKFFTLSSANTAARNASFNLWGNSSRPTVAELGDDSGWHFYSQRNTDNSVIFAVNGQIQPSNWDNIDSRYVKDVRLGSQQYYGVNNWQTWNFQCPSGHVLSGINVQDTGSNSADNIAGVYYRPVQKYINGTWYNVASV